jgi:hypothetical protein
VERGNETHTISGFENELSLSEFIVFGSYHINWDSKSDCEVWLSLSSCRKRDGESGKAKQFSPPAAVPQCALPSISESVFEFLIFLKTGV